MNICCQCGCVFDDDEIYHMRETHGEITACCPRCHGDFEEAEQCEICGEWFEPERVHEGVCDCCIDEALTKPCLIQKFIEEYGFMDDFVDFLRR